MGRTTGLILGRTISTRFSTGGATGCGRGEGSTGCTCGPPAGFTDFLTTALALGRETAGGANARKSTRINFSGGAGGAGAGGAGLNSPTSHQSNRWNNSEPAIIAHSGQDCWRRGAAGRRSDDLMDVKWTFRREADFELTVWAF